MSKYIRPSRFIIALVLISACAGIAYAAGVKCTACNGTGWRGQWKCTACGGDGTFGN